MIETSLLNGLRDEIKFNAQGIVLVDDTGTEVSDVISLAPLGANDTADYEWDTTTDGRLQIPQDIDYSISSGSTVAGWRAKTGSLDIGDNRDWDSGFTLGKDFNSSVDFTSDGTFTLEATGTYIDISEIV